jgi:hypothetical protein
LVGEVDDSGASLGGNREFAAPLAPQAAGDYAESVPVRLSNRVLIVPTDNK